MIDSGASSFWIGASGQAIKAVFNNNKNSIHCLRNLILVAGPNRITEQGVSHLR